MCDRTSTFSLAGQSMAHHSRCFIHSVHLLFLITKPLCTDVFFVFGMLVDQLLLVVIVTLVIHPCRSTHIAQPAVCYPSSQATKLPSPPCRYDGPLEYLTMWLCLFLSPAGCELVQALEKRSPKALSSLDIRPSMSAAKALAPHPLDMLRQLLKKSVP